ncbi:hypothetical protein V8C86DRAFT_3098042 [Haematococcus lacustris]
MEKGRWLRLAEGGGLAQLAPKFALVLNALQRAPGPALVYSDFRQVEGLALLTAALDTAGWVRLQLRGGRVVLPPVGRRAAPRYLVHGALHDDPEADSPEAKRLLLALFNGEFDKVPAAVLQDLRDLGSPPGRTRPTQHGTPSNLHGEIAKVLLISRSGAEGITTRNVREVHILEPFWHANRVEQVVGRAVRAHSHDADVEKTGLHA